MPNSQAQLDQSDRQETQDRRSVALLVLRVIQVRKESQAPLVHQEVMPDSPDQRDRRAILVLRETPDRKV